MGKKIICVSESLKNSLTIQGIDEKKCVTVYNGIDTSLVPSISPQEIRKILRISEDEIVIGTVGSLIKRKRIEDLIEAINIIIKNQNNFKLKVVIVGDGPERTNLEKLVEKKKGLKDRIIFTGFQSEVLSYINTFDIFVLTSEREGFSRVILEAMYLGKAVVASNIVGPSDLVLNGETGFLVEPRNAYAFAEKILTLIKNSDLRKRMGSKGKERVFKHFTVEQYVKGVEQIFEEVLEKR